MNLITLDYETFFSADYTLSRMTTEAYVRDPRFETLGCGVRTEDGQLAWLDADQFRDWVKRVDWSQTALLAHHAHFDGLILAHCFGVRPAFWFDTLSMARLIHGNHIRVGLDSLAKHYQLSGKTVPYDLFKGRRWSELDAYTRKTLADGCLHDVELTFELFKLLMRQFPREELPIVDLTVRMFTEPKLVGDRALFEQVRDEEALSKNERLYALGVGERDLQSAAKFTALIEAEGVEMVYKEGKNGPTPAIAKTDQFMRELCEHDNPTVAALASARLEVRSTLNETRAGRLADMAARGSLPVYLSYCGAHTTRWSGGDRVNFQNLPRGSHLRRALRAPDGYLIAAPDQSQGECRLVNWFAGQQDVVERFRRNEDPYLPMASAFYGRAITKADKRERQVGKGIELGCGFGMGGPKLGATLKRAGLELPETEAKRGVDVYRQTHPFVVKLWDRANFALGQLHRKETFAWGCLRGHDGRLYLPNDAWIDYTTLDWRLNEETGRHEWVLSTRNGWSRYHGPKLVENLIQALSRVITSQAMLRFKAMGYPVVGMSHDDCWLLVPDDGRAEEHERAIVSVMAATPRWAPDLPLGAECKLGKTYS